MAFNPLTDPIRQWADHTTSWLNGFMRNDTFVKGVRIEPTGVGADGRLNVVPTVLFAVRRPDDAEKYLTSVLQVNPLPPGDFRVRFVETLPTAVFGNFLQDLFAPKDGAGVAADIERQGRIDAKLAEARKVADASIAEKRQEAAARRIEARGVADADRAQKRSLAEEARIKARGEADAKRTASQSAAAQSRADARDQRIRDIGGRDAGWITAQGDAMQKRRSAWYDATTKAVAQTRTDRRARRAEQSDADYKLAEEARARAEAHRRASLDARARARIAVRTDVGQRAQDERKERQRIRLEGENARREARITNATDRVSDRITGREARLKARRDETLSNEQGWLDLLLGGQKARGSALQTALTEGVREALTGRTERQTLRTDASVARRTERQRRKALLAKAGQGWTSEPAPAPAPEPETVAGLYGRLDLFGATPLFEDDLFGFSGSLEDEVFGADTGDTFGADDSAFDPKALVLRTIEKTKAGTLPAPETWTRGLAGSALSVGEHLTGWVVEHVVDPVEAGTWDAIVLAGAAAAKGEIERVLDAASPTDRAAVSEAIDRVLA